MFLWNGKGDKIKRDIMINNYPAGSLKRIDILSFNKSLKTTWIKKYLGTENQGKWKLFSISLSNLNKIDTANIFKKQDNFLKEILLIWSEINFEECTTSASQFSEQSLWYNSLIRINDNPIFYKEWYRKGIIKVKHLRNRDENSLTLAEFQSKYNIKVQPLVYCGINFCTKNAMENVQPNRPLKRKQWIWKLFDKTNKSQKSKQNGVWQVNYGEKCRPYC